MFKECIENVRAKSPLVHNITNYVTVNDVANVVLAIGASPIMADDSDEVEDITSICGGLNINIGTLNHNTIPSMLKAGKKSNEFGHPVLLDPVGAGASALRTRTAQEIMNEVKISVLRGNMSEIKAVVKGNGTTKGVDADVADAVTPENIDDSVKFVKSVAEKFGCIVAVTGAIDLVADKERCYCIYNGRPEMSRITGTGCQLSGMTVAFCVANSDNMLEAVAASVCTMGLAGEKAMEKADYKVGNSTYRNGIIDEICFMTGDELEEGAKYEIK